MTVVLATGRIDLVRFGPDDARLLVDLDSDPEVMRFLTGRPTPTSEIEGSVLPRILAEYARGPTGGVWKAMHRGSGAFVGWFALHPTDPDRPYDLELGYRMRRAWWGHGIATEVARALIERGFSDRRMSRVFATTMAVNTRSRAVMERSGLRFVRVFHEHFDDPLPGTEHGEVEYALSREEYRRVSAPG